MPTIIDHIKRIEEAMKNDAIAPTLGLVLKNAAIAATIAGINSDEWKTYMSMFAESEDQLNLLTKATPSLDQSWLPEAQVYMISNSICAPATNTETGNGIFETPIAAAIDKNLNTDRSETVLAHRPEEFRNIFE